MARTDARYEYGLDEALERTSRFKQIGADILFVEAPRTVAEMERLCRELPGVHPDEALMPFRIYARSSASTTSACRVIAGRL